MGRSTPHRRGWVGTAGRVTDSGESELDDSEFDDSSSGEPTGIAERAAAWAAAGLISPEQRDAICRFEATTTVDRQRPTVAVSEDRVTPVAEVAGYLSGIVAVVGGFAIMGPRWDEIGLLVRLAIAGSIAIVGLVAGARLVRVRDRAAMRLGGFTWVIGAGGVALGVGTIVDRLGPGDERWIAVVTGVAVAAVGAMLWRNLDRPLQLATVAVGAVVAASALLDLSAAPIWLGAAVAWCGGAALGGSVAADRVRPRTTGFVIAAVTMTAGAFQLAARFERASAVLAVATAGAIVAIALVERSLALLAVGLVAFVMAVGLLMSTVLTGTAARTVAVVVGLVILASVGALAQRTVRS